jgi:tRNA(fMet)-specific endonuclease VapC
VRYLLDTNICIYLMQHSPPQLQARFKKLRVGDAVMSAITYAELRFGLPANPPTAAHNQAVLASLIEDLPVVPFAEAEAESHGNLATQFRQSRKNALDRLIAAHAVSLGVVLVTNNVADFRNYHGLKIENWVAA